jgi:hypothetical protein
VAVRVDPEGHELRTLLAFADPAGQHVLEVGAASRVGWRLVRSQSRRRQGNVRYQKRCR